MDEDKKYCLKNLESHRMSEKKNKVRSFSIYLLKKGYDATNTLEDEHDLQLEKAINLPEGALLYIQDGEEYPPWWRGYFGIVRDLKQVSKGALVFLPVGERWFALSFGHVYHQMKDEAYEYDFGLRVTLNALDPSRLISTDTVEPGAARRQRTQTPKESDLTYFDFDRDSSIIKSLTGKIRSEYRDLVRHVTGSSNLRISSDMQPDALISTCERLLDIYGRDDYKSSFPDLQNIVPTKDPTTIARLDAQIIEAFRTQNTDLCLAVPDIVHYADNVYVQFSGAGRATFCYADVDMQNYYDYLQSCDASYKAVDVAMLKKHKLILTDEEGVRKVPYNIYRSLIFDAELNGETYHLCDGDWYKVEASYMLRLSTFLDQYYEDQPNLPPYVHASEGAYNIAVAKSDKKILCMDEKNIAPTGQTQIEPCDLYGVSGSTAILYHVKVSTRSSLLSHLFSQGQNSVELLKMESEAGDKLKELVKGKVPVENEAAYRAPVDSGSYKVVYAIVSKKDKAKKSKNLPLFSRISLMRSIKALKTMSVEAVYCFVEDRVAKGAVLPKPKKKAGTKVRTNKIAEQKRAYNFPVNDYALPVPSGLDAEAVVIDPTKNMEK